MQRIDPISGNTLYIDLFARILLSLLPPLLVTPLPPLISAPFRSFLPPPRKVFCSVERRAQHRAWRGAVSEWTSPQSSGRKFILEICMKKGQYLDHGPIPVSAETLDELPAPLVHTNFPENKAKGPLVHTNVP